MCAWICVHIVERVRGAVRARVHVGGCVCMWVLARVRACVCALRAVFRSMGGVGVGRRVHVCVMLHTRCVVMGGSSHPPHSPTPLGYQPLVTTTPTASTTAARDVRCWCRSQSSLRVLTSTSTCVHGNARGQPRAQCKNLRLTGQLGLKGY